MKSALFITVIILILLFIPTIGYPETDDSTSYALLTKSFASGEGYAINGNPDVKYLPMFPILSVPFSLLTGSFTLGIRLTALVLGLISLLAFYCIGRHLFKEKRYFILLFISPLLVLYSTFRGLSESPLICFSLLSVLFFLKAGKDKRFFLLSGLFFGLASLSRHIGIVIGIAYIIFFLLKERQVDNITLLKKGRFNRYITVGLILGFLIFSTLFIRSFLLFGDPFHTGYAETLTKIPLFLKIPAQFVVFIPALLLLSGLFFIPLFLKGIKRENMLFLLIIVIGAFFASAGNLRFRYLAPLIPFVLIVAYDGFLRMKDRWKPFLILGIALNLILAPYFVNGHFKDLTDSVYQTPPRWGQAGLRHLEAVSWVNQNLPQDSVILIRHDPIWGEYFRPDLNILNYSSFYSLSGEMWLLWDWESSNVLNGGLKLQIIESIESTTFQTRFPIEAVYKMKSV